MIYNSIIIIVLLIIIYNWFCIKKEDFVSFNPFKYFKEENSIRKKIMVTKNNIQKKIERKKNVCMDYKNIKSIYKCLNPLYPILY